MEFEYHSDPEMLVHYGAFPPIEEDEGRAQVAHRDAAARAIGWHLQCTACGALDACECDPLPPRERVGGHPSHGFQYGIDISAGNVDCVMVKRVKGKPPLIVLPDLETGEYPDGAEPATVCRYDSWR